MVSLESKNLARVFKKMGFSLSKIDIENVVKCSPDSIEKVLKYIKNKLANYKNKKSGGAGGYVGKLGMPKKSTGAPFTPIEGNRPRAEAAPAQAVVAPMGQWNLQSEVDTEILIEKE